MALEKVYTPTLGHGFLFYEKLSLSISFIAILSFYNYKSTF